MDIDHKDSKEHEDPQGTHECHIENIEQEKNLKVLTNNSEDSEVVDDHEKSAEQAFKKPALIIGPRRGQSGGVRPISLAKSSTDISKPSSDESAENISKAEPENESVKVTSIVEQKQFPLPYKEPSWGGKPEKKYKIEVLKSGVILESIDLTKKSFHVIGRLPVCDIPLAHPTISRYHAIIQYRAEGDEKNRSGLYIYDLESTHGTFWNGCRIKPKTYVTLRGGHMIKFGCSQRKFIFHTPQDEEDEESEYSVSELKEMRRLELIAREKAEKEREEAEKELERLRKEKEAEDGINWGMAEDADEESDLTENPYAQTNNEELFLDDPKKTLRGWFEREGYDLQYQTEEKGVGQFLCWIELPIDNLTGGPVRAEALVKGKKKEAVVQCALEACRILDRQGLLRQATHEGRKRKIRNWEQEDYYDSDEDNFLDRTGTIERKREQRMKNAGKIEDKIETYGSLLDKHTKVVQKLTEIEVKLKNHQKANDTMNSDTGEDALDVFMSNLSSALLNKSEIIKLKMQLQNLRKEEENLKKLVEITKPANLPSLNLPNSTNNESVNIIENSVNLDKRQRVEIVDDKTEQIVKNSGRYGLIDSKDVAVERENQMAGNDDSIQLTSEEKSNEIENNDKKTEDNEDNKVDDLKLIQVEMKKKKRNMRRMQLKAEKEMQKGYDQDTHKEDYSMWLPPQNQSGDGRTSLNEKFGY